MNGWENVGIIHTVPLDDLHPHALTPQCACGPSAEIVEESRVLQVTHNAFDGRDFDERDAEISKARVANIKEVSCSG